MVLTKDSSFVTVLVGRGGIDLLLKCSRTKVTPFTLARPHSYIAGFGVCLYALPHQPGVLPLPSVRLVNGFIESRGQCTPYSEDR